ncbi:phenylpropionate dioxygenase [Mycobacterium pseudoshottsii JCM 15466]|uniref:Uncharacterized protein n=1 Tax=Mycobacterium pseudoshottsii TaxID=265949 RepID=A0A9N7QMP8_9MYCO|nr:Phenylpropionate dioxygenase [Mycobacterium sp. 012931]RFZ69070.1 hypothetical protein DL240490_01457 [Mycobacterium marinum]BBA89904.1 hypothetical protein MPSD_45730 [Mycobacterium pseudoshottsii JCM 15466]BDN84308.1 hypothetical protein NJB1907Z4_C45230 [Mycobacterium pseudoshottsii]BEH78691.1 hypothetical protein YM3MPS_44940 [Mycobacterium pseudoshottsii]
MTAVRQPSALLPTLGGAYYTSAAVFAAEQQHVFESMWFCVVRAADLNEPGQFKAVQVGRESVLLVRGGIDGCAPFSTSAGIEVRCCAPSPRDRCAGICAAPITPGPTDWTAP